jgi:predicted MPP superfamily phosphohydrolase
MKILIISILGVLLYFAFSQRLNTVIYKLNSPKIKSRVRIAVLGDLHCESYGKGQAKLIKTLRKIKPDIVVFTGDIFDKHFADKGSYVLLKTVGSEYKAYFVTGNHEFKRGMYEKIPELMSKVGVNYLDGKVDDLMINGNKVILCGVDDYDSDYFLKSDGFFENQINLIANRNDKESYGILLCHQPQVIEFHKKAGVDLVISGHAHGGQWSLPFIKNGLFAPDEGFFPKLSAGNIKMEGYHLVVTRGLARHAVPIPRIFNRPEITVIDLEGE